MKNSCWDNSVVTVTVNCIQGIAVVNEVFICVWFVCKKHTYQVLLVF